MLLVLSLVIGYAGGSLALVFSYPGWTRLALNVLTGGLLAALVLATSRALRAGFRWARILDAEFRAVMGPVSVSDAWILAAASGFVEELFFRATLQPVLGLWVTSIGFGILHYPMNRRMIPWTAMATLLGLVFGIVYDQTGSLVAVAFPHGLVNLVELLGFSRPAAEPAGEKPA